MAIIGIDEVGRGPWAGPLVIGAVILPDSKPDWVADLKDSKKLTPKKREDLNQVILAKATATGLGWVWPAEIDTFGLSQSLRLATRRALKSLNSPKSHKSPKFSQIIIDGNTNFLSGTPLESRTSTLIKADDTIKEVSAASIIAKVARDHYMCELAQKYPCYGFEKHKGYGTAQHKKALAKFGPCPAHRQSFAPVRQALKQPTPASQPPKSTPASQTSKLTSVPQNSKNPPDPQTSKSTPVHQPTKNSPTSIGTHAESIVADFLVSHGHTLIAHNYKTKSCEIDLVSILGTRLYFTEVKYRRDSSHGDGISAITPIKKHQMEFSSQVFLQNHPKFRELDPILAVASASGPDFTIQDFFTLAE